MKNKILLTLTVFIPGLIFSQSSSFFAISSAEEQHQWLNIQMINGKDVQKTQTLYNYKNQNVYFINAVTNTAIPTSNSNPRQTGPTGSMVAAAGFDAQHQQLFFIPMFVPELRWADVSNPAAPRYFAMDVPVLSQLNFNNPANQITRMTIGADNNGYALSNDGNQFIRFTTGIKPIAANLGALVDAASNGQNSVHNQCSGWGGDLVAADDGSLYLFTQKAHVYQINITTRIAKYLGHINGLPENFTTNGAAVDENGEVVVSCATGNFPLYRLSLKTLSAQPAFGQASQVFNVSDMASGHLLFQKKAADRRRPGTQRFILANQKVSIYPNPVTENRLNVNFESVTNGIHHVQLLDLSGKILLTQVVNISGIKQIRELKISAALSKGVYLVNVLNEKAQIIYSEKIILQ